MTFSLHPFIHCVNQKEEVIEPCNFLSILVGMYYCVSCILTCIHFIPT